MPLTLSAFMKDGWIPIDAVVLDTIIHFLTIFLSHIQLDYGN